MFRIRYNTVDAVGEKTAIVTTEGGMRRVNHYRRQCVILFRCKSAVV